MEITYFAIGFVIGLIFLAMTLTSRGRMYIPEHWHAFLPYTVLLTALYLEERLKGTSLAIILIEIGALISWAALEIKGAMYQAYITGWGKERKQETAPEAKTDEPVLTPLVRAIPQLMEKTVEPVRFDMERQFAKTLIIMRDYKPNEEAVDLREETWKRPNKFGSRDAYLLTRDKWEERGIIGKKTKRKNSPYAVKDWRAVQLIADGNPLP